MDLSKVAEDPKDPLGAMDASPVTFERIEGFPGVRAIFSEADEIA